MTLASVSLQDSSAGAMRWHGPPNRLIGPEQLTDLLWRLSSTAYVVNSGNRLCGTTFGGIGDIGILDNNQTGSSNGEPELATFPLLGIIPPCRPHHLGDARFRAAHGLRYAYVAGAMANGIASVELVEAMSRAGMLGFFGAAGLPLDRIETAIDRLQVSLAGRPWGANLIHSPHDAALEAGTVDLYLRRGVTRMSASAYLGLTIPLVRYRVSGIHRDADGHIRPLNHVFGKVSRIEVGRKFFSPPPQDMLVQLVAEGAITHEQALMAEQIPVAEDLTAEADSGGHTDNQPALALLPTMLALRDSLQPQYPDTVQLRVGAAGGIATPASAAAAFAMGAAYILTGSINQSCAEAGTSDAVKDMLARAQTADVAMAPAADMFEMGVQVQVLKWGTMFAIRARKLYELYRNCASMEAIPAGQRATLERDYYRQPLEEVWRDTQAFFMERDPAQVERAAADPKHKLALVFRSYLGRASTWANAGDATRKADYQVWCGPAMGAFNEWARGSCLEPREQRDAVTVALNLLFGAAFQARICALRAQGVVLPAGIDRVHPRPVRDLVELTGCAA